MIEQFRIESDVPLPPAYKTHEPGSCKCGNMPRAGYKTCDRCLSDVKRFYRKRRAQGLCGWGACNEQAAEGHASCQKHLTRSSDNIRALLNGRVADGLCRRCGEPRFADDSTWCLGCRVKQGYGILPVKTRKVIRQFWRLDRILTRRTKAEECLPLLDGRAVEVFSLRHGLYDGVDHTLEEIGQRLNITRERVRQIEEKSLYVLTDRGIDVSGLWPPYETQRPPRKSARKGKLTPEEATRRNRARAIARAAIQRGDIKPKPCEKCGEKGHGHHRNYDDPLDLQWICRKHHLKAHGKKPRKIVEKKRLKRRDWISSLGPASSTYFSAPSVRTALLAGNPKLKTLTRGIGISRAVLLKVLHGERVTSRILGKVLRYVETLKQSKAAPVRLTPTEKRK